MRLEFSKVGSTLKLNRDVILIVEDELVENGIDRVLERIASLRSHMDIRLNSIDDRLRSFEMWQSAKCASITIALLVVHELGFGGTSGFSELFQ